MHQKLSAEKAELEEVMTKGSSYIKDMEDKVRKVDNEKKEIDRQVSIHSGPKSRKKFNLEKVHSLPQRLKSMIFLTDKGACGF